MAVVVQSAMGHLNGWPSHSFDQEECYARATVAATRSQSLTVVGMIQVLAAGTHPIQEVHQATSNWTMPELRSGETQLEQSDKEIASWRLNHTGHSPSSIQKLKSGENLASTTPDLFWSPQQRYVEQKSRLGPLRTCSFEQR